jgi:DMSO/TMAO reductase YedYZ molybdopterin-dependent catalytic subunit
VSTPRRAPVTAGPAPPGRRLRLVRRVLGGLAGVLAAAVALGVAELVAGIVGPRSSPVLAVGAAAIALTPEPVKEFAVRQFGAQDKLALVTGTLVVVAGCAALVGLLALRRRALGAAGVAVLGLVGVLAAVTRPAARVVDVLPSLVGVVAGVVALLALTAPLGAADPTDGAGDADDAGDTRDAAVPGRLRQVLTAGDGASLDRRRFLVTGAVALGGAAVAGGGGRLLQRRSDVAAERAALTLPRPAVPAPALPPGSDLSRRVPGLTPLVTRNADFYRVDTALVVPQLRPSTYRLALTGMLDRPRSWSLDDLLGRRDLVERDVTLTCVSNEVGGTLTGTARWLGVPLAALLREAGIRPASTQLVCRSADGMTIGASTRAALGTPDAMLAVGMNGEPLPVEHGFPVRMVIPGLYGYVSACKWLTGIEASTYEAYDAYWVQRGYAAQAPVKTGSRIDTPAAGRTVPAGRRAVAGVAWAQGRGIARVELRVDDAGWVPAQLSPADDADIWRQWFVPVDLAPGAHQLTVRATAADGELQTGRRTGIVPDGATGWHTVRVVAA